MAFALPCGMLSAWDFIRRGAILSAIFHVVLVAGAFGLFAHPKLFEASNEPVTVDIVSPKDIPKFDVPDFDVPEFGTKSGDTQKRAATKTTPAPTEPAPTQPAPTQPAPTQSASTAAPSAPPAKPEPPTKPEPSASQPAPAPTPPAPTQSASIEPPAQPERPGQATFTPAPAMPQSAFAPTQIPALLDLVTPAASAGLAPLAEVPADIAADDISNFKTHLRKCWSPPADLARDSKLKVTLRVFLARNGALSQQPVLMAASASPSGPALVQAATAAMRRCAPFNILPADRYKEWKVLDITLSAGDMGGG